MGNSREISMPPKYKYLIVVFTILAFATIIISVWLRQRNNVVLQNSPTVIQIGPATLPNIPTPAGWKEVQSDGQITDFKRISVLNNTKSISNGIEVGLDKHDVPLEVLINNGALNSSFTSTQTWNVINDHLILGIMLPTQATYTIIVRNGSNPDYDYSFSLRSVWEGVNPGQFDLPINPDDLKTLQTMVSTFAESLPSTTPQ